METLRQFAFVTLILVFGYCCLALKTKLIVVKTTIILLTICFGVSSLTLDRIGSCLICRMEKIQVRLERKKRDE